MKLKKIVCERNYNEKEIIALLQEPGRQREAFENIVKAYSETLYWQIRRLVLSHEDANDILQNTFIKAWQNIEYFRGEAKMSTWLFRIAFNECLSFTVENTLLLFGNCPADIVRLSHGIAAQGTENLDNLLLIDNAAIGDG